MRHYHRDEYRHLSDGERYRDPEFLADDAWLASERGRTEATEEERPNVAPSWYSHEGFSFDERTKRMRSMPRRVVRLTSAWDDASAFAQRVIRGIFRGKGPKNWVRSDTRIHDDVCETLARDPEIDASGIEVEVKAGEVTLRGVVDSRRTKRRAEDVLDHILGVIDVHNRLSVAR